MVMKSIAILFVMSVTLFAANAGVLRGTDCENNCASNYNYCVSMIGDPSMPKLDQAYCDSIYASCMERCAGE